MSQDRLASLLNSRDCEEILNKFNRETNNQFQFESFKIEPATEVKGFLGEYLYLTIQCVKSEDHERELNAEGSEHDAGVLKFFIKQLPTANEQDEFVAIFHKESFLYATLLPKLQNHSPEPWCPKVYLCRRNLLVLEDLDSEGFYSLASREFLQEPEMLPVLNGLAAMHASSLLYEFETKENIEVLYGEGLKEITVQPDVAWFTTGLKAVLTIAQQLSKYQTEVMQTFIGSELAQHLNALYNMVNPSRKYRNVLCHRDTWAGNIFLKHSEPHQSAVFVDFQTCRYSPPAIDVIFTLFMNLSKQERLEKQPVYIDFYYQQLMQHVKNRIPSAASLSDVIFSKAELLESIEEFMLFGYVYRALAISILKVPKEFITDHYKHEERAERLLQYMRENAVFCQMMTESVEDIIEAVKVEKI